MINRHFLIPMLKSQLLRHTAIFDPAQAKKPEMAAMALTECSVAMASTVETVAWTATWVVMVAVVSTAELDNSFWPSWQPSCAGGTQCRTA